MTRKGYAVGAVVIQVASQYASPSERTFNVNILHPFERTHCNTQQYTATHCNELQRLSVSVREILKSKNAKRKKDYEKF